MRGVPPSDSNVGVQAGMPPSQSAPVVQRATQAPRESPSQLSPAGQQQVRVRRSWSWRSPHDLAARVGHPMAGFTLLFTNVSQIPGPVSTGRVPAQHAFRVALALLHDVWTDETVQASVQLVPLQICPNGQPTDAAQLKHPPSPRVHVWTW